MGNSYLFNDELEHDLRRRAQVVHLDELGFVQAVVRREGLEEAVRALVEGHGPVWVSFGEGDGGVVCCLQVAQALGVEVSVGGSRRAFHLEGCGEGGDGLGLAWGWVVWRLFFQDGKRGGEGGFIQRTSRNMCSRPFGFHRLRSVPSSPVYSASSWRR